MTGGNEDLYYLTISDEGYIDVYVYVASQDSEGNSWYGNEEFLDLIGLHVADEKNYFPAGKIQLPRSILNGKTNVAAAGAALLNTESDWATVISALAGIQTGEDLFTTEYASNANNSVGDYNSQAAQDTGYGWDTQHSALFRWNDGEEHRGFNDNTGTVKYHLDLCFNTNRITFITGNNGIDTGGAKDDTEIDSRVYITGSEVQPPRNLNIPEGYKFTGYFEDKDFNTEWTGIYQPLIEDETVYIRIEPLQNAVIYYEMLPETGAGTLDLSYESFSPARTPQGSTATAVSGYKFVGWHYYDSDTEEYVLVTPDAKLNPRPNDMNTSQATWQEGEERTYYAIFEPDTTDVTITKTFSSLPEDLWDDAAATITFTVKQDNEEIQTGIKLENKNGVYTAVIPELVIGEEYTIEETAPDLTNYDLTQTTVAVNGADPVEGTVGTITVSDSLNNLVYANTYAWKTASLTIKNQIAGNVTGGTVTNQFVFNIQQNIEGLSQNQIASGNYGGVQFVNGQATVTIQAANTDGITMPGLPVGTYTITETAPGDIDFDTTDIKKDCYLNDTTYQVDSNSPTTGQAEVTLQANTHVVTVTNEYVPYKTVTVTKAIDGGMGSHDDWFDFRAYIIENDGTEIRPVDVICTEEQKPDNADCQFRLKHNSSVEIVNLKMGDEIQITELIGENTGYRVSKIEADLISQSEKISFPSLRICIRGENFPNDPPEEIEKWKNATNVGTITFTNYRPAVAPTGLESNHTTPYVLMITAAGMAGLALIGGIVARRIRRRRQE